MVKHKYEIDLYLSTNGCKCFENENFVECNINGRVIIKLNHHFYLFYVCFRRKYPSTRIFNVIISTSIMLMHNFLISLLSGEIGESTMLDHEERNWNTHIAIKIKERKGNNEISNRRNVTK